MKPPPDIAIEIVNEPAYAFGSRDNARHYTTEVNLSGSFKPSSIHGIVVNGTPLIVVGASGGATGAHSHGQS